MAPQQTGNPYPRLYTACTSDNTRHVNLKHVTESTLDTPYLFHFGSTLWCLRANAKIFGSAMTESCSAMMEGCESAIVAGMPPRIPAFRWTILNAITMSATVNLMKYNTAVVAREAGMSSLVRLLRSFVRLIGLLERMG